MQRKKTWNGIKALLLTSSIRGENQLLPNWVGSSDTASPLFAQYQEKRVFLPLSADLPPPGKLAYILAGPGSIRHWQQHLPLAFATMSNYRTHQKILMYPRKSCSSRNVIHANTFTFQGLQVLSSWREAGFRDSMSCQSLPEDLRNTLSCKHEC